MFAQEIFQTRLSDMMKAKSSRHHRGCREGKNVQFSRPCCTRNPCHAEELQSLEEKLTSKYEADLKTRVESTVAEALKAKPTTNAEADQKAAIDAAIADYEKQAQARFVEEITSAAIRHAEDVASAADRGRMEVGTSC